MPRIWTDEAIEILTTLLRNGASRKEIARKLNVTADAISGAITRYGLSDHAVQKTVVSKFLENTDFEMLDESNFEEIKARAKLNWKVPKSTLKADKRAFDIGIFWPDTHVPHHNKPACRAMLKLMSDIKFDIFTIMGDFVDLGSISHWNKNRHRTLELKRLKSEYIEANAILDEIDKRLPSNARKIYCMGNHELWANDLLEDIPALEGMIEPESQLFLSDRNYKVYEYNKLAKIGRLYVTHGIYAGANPIKKHLDELKVNILFAHTHTLGMRLSSSAARDIAFAGYNVGCICDLGPEYMKNRPNSWTHGFAVGYFYPNGYFDVQLVRIVEGKFIFNNKVYDGNV